MNSVCEIPLAPLKLSVHTLLINEIHSLLMMSNVVTPPEFQGGLPCVLPERLSFDCSRILKLKNQHSSPFFPLCFS